MEKKKFSRQLLTSMLAVSLGLSTLTNSVLAVNGEDEFTWEKVENFETDRLNKYDQNDEDPAYSDDEEVRALIVFDEDSILDKGYMSDSLISNWLAKSYAKHLISNQEKMADKITDEALNGDELDVRYNFTVMTNAVSADVTYKEVQEIREVEGVKAVYVLPQYEVQTADADPNTITSGEMVGSYNTWMNGYTGAGMRIAIVDTGLNVDHPSFDSDAFEYALEEQAAKEGVSVEDYDLLDADDIEAVLDDLQASGMMQDVTAEELYRNEKVPFAFSYIDRDLEVEHDDVKGDGHDHGTHVAGISTANKYVETNDGFVPQENGVVGIAPNAQLLVMKVFGGRGGAWADDYMAAIQDALLLGADTINLSLGSANGGESKETAEAELYINEIMDKLTETDTVVVFSAGNAGAWADNSYYGALISDDINMHTVGSPGSYTNGFTVASANNAGSTGYAAEVNGNYFFYTETDYTNAPFVTLDTTGEGSEYDYVFIDGVGTDDNYEGLDVTDKIVFVSRGVISFSEKHMFAAAHGAAGVYVYNNTVGSIAMDLSGSTATIPCASITQAEGLYVKENSTPISDIAYTGKVTITSEILSSYDSEANVTMSDFSSWGVSGDLSLKPEITAPGGNIYSTLDKGTYGLMSGTSMAAPSVAGMVALAMEYIEKNGLDELTGLSPRALAMSLLMSTATPLTEEDGEAYSPRNQGAGLANIEHATTSPVYILMDKNGTDGKVKAELGDDPERNGVYTFGFTLYNLTDEKQYYTFDADVLTEELIQNFFVIGTSYELNPSLDVVSNTVYLYDLDEDGDVDQDDALILLQVVNGTNESEIVAANENVYDFNSDGVIDTTDVYLFLQLIAADEADVEAVVVDDKTHVEVTITLSDEDKAYLDESYANGMYVDGFFKLDGNVDLSIPFLAFYGNWADASMFEHVDYLDPEYGYSYSETYDTNVFIDAYDYVVGGNGYADDEVYMPERNAISSEFGNIGRVIYTLIRNAYDVTITAMNAETGEIYKSVDLGEQISEFYYDNGGYWVETALEEEFYWDVTDGDGQPLPEGTQVEVTIQAIPAYYKDAETVDGDGINFTLPLTVDNTAPELLGIYRNDADEIEAITQDNNYVAAILVFDRSGNPLSRYAVNQTTVNDINRTVIEIPEKVVYVAAVDYAGNMTTYRVNNTSESDTEYTTGVIVAPQEAQLFVGSQMEVIAYALPETLLDTDVVWSSSNEEVAVVDETGIVYGLSEGTAEITATTVAVDTNGNHLSDSCTVTVTKVDQDFVGLMIGETVDWGSFKASDAENHKVLAESGDYLSATAWGPLVLACTFDGQIDYYLGSDLSYLGTLGVIGEDVGGLSLTDMARGEDSAFAYGTYGPYVIWFETYDLENYNVLDFSEYCGGANVNGITYVGHKYSGGSLLEIMAVSTTAGDIYLLTFDVYTGEARTYELISQTGLPSYYLGCSLMYNPDVNYLFWAAMGPGYASYFVGIDMTNGAAKPISVADDGNTYCGLMDAAQIGTELQSYSYKGITGNAVEIKDYENKPIEKIDMKLDKGVND